MLKSGASGLTTSNLITYASNYGNQYQHWNGFDLTANSRLFGGVTATGGVTFGQQMLDNCDIVSKLPELLTTPLAGLSPLQDCHFVSGWAPRLQGARVVHAAVAEHPSQRQLPEPGRPGPAGVRALHAGADHRRPRASGRLSPATSQPWRSSRTTRPDSSARTFGDRLNQLDFRFSKIFKFGKSTLDANFDLYNAFNSDAVLTENAAYSGANGGAWLLPTSVIQGRIIKFGVRWDF